MGDKSLNDIQFPVDLRACTPEDLPSLADQLRQETIKAVSQTGGHLGAGLGVVELTLALHYVFNTPVDKVIWDVGHQAYPHKILTGRKDAMPTLRKEGGLCGFTKRGESEYDPFGAGHSSTSISAALGMAVARDLKKEDYECIAVIGDGAMSAGMAYEALNNAGDRRSRVIIILNDNKMSIAPAVGAMSRYLSRMISSKPYLSFRSFAKQLASKLPSSFENAARKAEQYTKDFFSGGNFFEQMGCYYVGPVDGHNLDELVPILTNIRDADHIEGPILLHVVTQKGYGFEMSDAKKEKLHAVPTFDIDTATPHPKKEKHAPTYTQVFADSLSALAAKDPSVVGITAAMPSGTGMDSFAEKFPDRMFDVGIAEQHAVTFAAGLATEGIKPFCAIYSTFLQRAYDQIVHDVAIQSLPVRFAIDRAGLVGADGPTHAGAFDTAFLGSLPNMVLMAASDENELARMVVTAHGINDRPSAFRYPRGEGFGVKMDADPKPLSIGKGRIISKGEKIAFLSYGTRLNEVKKAAAMFAKSHEITPTIADARFAKPLDHALIDELVGSHDILITIEEGSCGGFGSFVLDYLATSGQLSSCKISTLHLPDSYTDHASQESQYANVKLDAQGIYDHAFSMFSR